MHIERIHRMIECLTEKTLSELDKGIENVNVEEMSEAVDMINAKLNIARLLSSR